MDDKRLKLTMERIYLFVVLIITLFFTNCATMPQGGGENIVKVVTVIDTIEVEVYDTVEIEHKVKQVVYDTLMKVINDTITVNKVVEVIENNIDTKLSLDTNLAIENRLLHLQVAVADNKIRLNVQSNGLINNELELVPQKPTLINNWYVLFGLGFIAGVIVFFILRTFAKWVFNFK
jgi:hypothetical protein